MALHPMIEQTFRDFGLTPKAAAHGRALGLGMTEGLWEIEVELAFELFACSGDPDAFREDLGHLGFQPDEIERYMEWRPS